MANVAAVQFVGSQKYTVNETQKDKFGRIDKSKLKCDYCNGTKHTRETCFKLVGYPEWWPNPKIRGKSSSSSSHTNQSCLLENALARGQSGEEMDQVALNKIVQEM